jgi:D-lactate dehydrogenase (cytochrome)
MSDSPRPSLHSKSLSLPPYSVVTAEITSRIREAVGETAVVLEPEKLVPFARDATEYYCLPELVVEATSAEQIQALLRLANEYRFPVTPRGLGTGLTGGSVPVHGGVVLSLSKMNRILSIDPHNLISVVEPGVVNLDLKKAARARGLFYPPDPASLDTCSIGGNAATNAGGPACVKYGTTRDYILGLQAVLPSGEIIRTGVQTRKGVVGYDLTRLIVGSEGTLGVITELTLKLIPHPPAVTTLVALFPDLVSAMRGVSSILVRGFVPCAMEIMDRHCLDLIGDLLPFEGVEEAGAFLLVESDGVSEVIEKQIEQIGAICMECDAVNVLMAPDSHKRAQMWRVRKEVSLRIEHSTPLYVPEDVVVPIGRIAEFVESLPEFEERHGIRIYSFGHAGDGNIHLNITAESRIAAERVEQGVGEILKRVTDMGGTLSGEHGIGIAKSRFLPLELSAESIRLQRGIKRLFDPQLILNPGKIFDSVPES